MKYKVFFFVFSILHFNRFNINVHGWRGPRARLPCTITYISNLVYFKGNTPDIFNIYFIIYWPIVHIRVHSMSRKKNEQTAKQIFMCSFHNIFDWKNMRFLLFFNLHICICIQQYIYSMICVRVLIIAKYLFKNNNFMNTLYYIFF